MRKITLGNESICFKSLIVERLSLGFNVIGTEHDYLGVGAYLSVLDWAQVHRISASLVWVRADLLGLTEVCPMGWIVLLGWLGCP